MMRVDGICVDVFNDVMMLSLAIVTKMFSQSPYRDGCSR